MQGWVCMCRSEYVCVRARVLAGGLAGLRACGLAVHACVRACVRARRAQYVTKGEDMGHIFKNQKKAGTRTHFFVDTTKSRDT